MTVIDILPIILFLDDMLIYIVLVFNYLLYVRYYNFIFAILPAGIFKEYI